MGGYGWSPRGNHGEVARRLRAHCLVLWDDDVPHVLLRADVISFPRDVHRAIWDAVVEEGLVESDRFLLAGSHTHSGACLGDTRPDPRILMGLNDADVDAVDGSTGIVVDRLVQLVRDTADQERTEVVLGFGVGSAEIGFNRVGLSTVLSDVPVLLVRDLDDDPFAVLFGAACHPVSRGNDSVFDSDYPGAAAEAIEDELGVPALFFLGAAGDQDPDGSLGPPLVEEIGDAVASAVLDVVGDSTSPVTGPIRVVSAEVRLPLSVDLSDPRVAARLRGRYEDRLADPAVEVRRHAEAIIGLADDDDLPTFAPMPIQVWRFDGLAIAALSHEVLSSYDVTLHERFPEPLWVLAYSGEVECYVPDEECLAQGGYEAGWTDDNTIAGEGSATMPYRWPVPFEEGIESTIVDTTLTLLDVLAARRP
ncbi:hypothetical protein GCM10022243_29260 [Saccharothrix violaceirubra]|uniref:Neutral/alkaline ceramidase-like enzyme n=1 Tax=Saccharothrix violaceirubra TaxID=413306 RepID=A0A7W7T9R5_9PSEU|nr:hypothetical protein [Saccharothrix violaceirubra]MBB4969149.1 hypothetical protein [Saccharothrix violaceirubra]